MSLLQAPGALVYAKIKGWPLWPSQVCDPQLALPHVLSARCVARPVLINTFGDHKYMWTALGSLSAYSPLTVQASPHRLLKVAVAEADKIARENPGALVPISKADAKAAVDSAALRKSTWRRARAPAKIGHRSTCATGAPESRPRATSRRRQSSPRLPSPTSWRSSRGLWLFLWRPEFSSRSRRRCSTALSR
ncbi:hypothetical protein T492DRAFT_212634 [Pavlovales sp. CCMP2436]|nr:hypothetical protein T492DRAFT_212634 [Pavlovales sp. CCMP2436]